MEGGYVSIEEILVAKYLDVTIQVHGRSIKGSKRWISSVRSSTMHCHHELV